MQEFMQFLCMENAGYPQGKGRGGAQHGPQRHHETPALALYSYFFEKIGGHFGPGLGITFRPLCTRLCMTKRDTNGSTKKGDPQGSTQTGCSSETSGTDLWQEPNGGQCHRCSVAGFRPVIAGGRGTRVNGRVVVRCSRRRSGKCVVVAGVSAGVGWVDGGAR